ncbi:catechol 2,3-dioxygenase [Bacillus mesophilus]|uniref:VOC family protein n=1 Tax=Bacillus mesophilus TaxID=1808955 RepID=A0A6M0Q1G4_9BACI|nr:VOC family protein [Bacillus mesophilus]MBM7659267.1 catechol 2,3-dioxygenase [Bacillus mesophilus]NEY70141.1 VOC family protein [Bacillus mesophilus]
MKFHESPTTYINQVAIKVQSMERSIQFYVDVIGLKVLKKNRNHTVLTADGIYPLLQLEQPEKVIPKQARSTGLYHFALLVPTRADLADVLHHLIDKGYPLEGASDHLVSEAIYLSDPDGNGIEIYVDRLPETWKWEGEEVVMASKPLNSRELLSYANNVVWKGMPPETIMGHIHLHVSDLTLAREFYCNGLGFTIVSHYGNQALFISSGRYHHHIGLNTWNGIGAPTPDERSVGLEWFSIVFPNMIDLEEAIKRLTALNVGCMKEEGYYKTEDPSGNIIRLIVE